MRRVRRFGWDDLDGLLEVRAAGAALEPGQPPTSREALAAYWSKGGVQAERDLCLVDEDGRIVAYGGLRPWHGPGWAQAELMVRPERRRQGLGRALLRRLVVEARGRGAHYLAAMAPDQPGDAAGFLRQNGFELLAARQHMRLRPVAVPRARAVPGYRLRLAGLEDSGILAEITNQAYAGSRFTDLADGPGYRRYMEESGAQVFVAERAADGWAAGLCEVRARETALEGREVPSGHIASLAVRPENRGQGLGCNLLARGIRCCLEAGWPTVELNVDRDNLAALRLYERAGFRPTYAFSNYFLALTRGEG